MSTYCSMPNLPRPDGALFFDVAYDCFGNDLRIILDGKACYPTPDEARAIAATLLAAASLSEECAVDPEGEGDGCDCTELCAMGPTCPGGGLAGLAGSGCWRTGASA